MLQQSSPYVTGGDANNGVFPSIVGWRATKQLNSDKTLFQSITITGQRLIDNVLEKLRAPVTALEGRSFKDLCQLPSEGRHYMRRLSKPSNLCLAIFNWVRCLHR
jgi:hypothetical protein